MSSSRVGVILRWVVVDASSRFDSDLKLSELHARAMPIAVTTRSAALHELPSRPPPRATTATRHRSRHRNLARSDSGRAVNIVKERASRAAGAQHSIDGRYWRDEPLIMH